MLSNKYAMLDLFVQSNKWYTRRICVTIRYESACGPVAVLVFKTGERGDELRWWVRLPRALAITHHAHM